MSTSAPLAKIRDLLEMIKFSHTVFAFPFALMGALLAGLKSIAPAKISATTARRRV